MTMENASVTEKRQLLGLKRTIKTFEKQFEKEHGRQSTEEDLTEEIKECRRLYSALKAAGVVQSQQKENCEGGHGKPHERAEAKVGIIAPSPATKKQKCVSPENDAGVFGRAFNKSTGSSTDGPALPSMARLRKWSKLRHVSSKACGVSVTGSKLEEDACGVSVTGSKLKGDECGDSVTGGKMEEDACGVSVTGSKLKGDECGDSVTGGKMEEDACGTSTAEATRRTEGSLGGEDGNGHGLVLDTSGIGTTADIGCVGAATPPPCSVHEGSTSLTPPSHASDVAPHAGSPTEVLLASMYTTSSAKCEQLGDAYIHRLKGSVVRRQESDTVGAEVTPSMHGEVHDVYEGEESCERGPVCGSEEEEECEPPAKKQRRVPASQSSEVSQNFVRLNMKIRRYKRKGQSSTSKFRKHRFGKKDTCYKCGGKGHWARDCPASTNLGTFDGEEVRYCEDQEEGVGAGEKEECTAQEETLEVTCDGGGVGSMAVVEEERMERGSEPVLGDGTAANSIAVLEPPATGRRSAKKSVSRSVSSGRKRKRPAGGKKAKEKTDGASEDSVWGQPSSVDVTWDFPAMDESDSRSLCTELMTDGGVADEKCEDVCDALKRFGFHGFRPGQREVIERILAGKSTLCVQSTGTGKSLCYQIPAYLFWRRRKAVTLVVSPLVSLMEDQVKSMPACLKGACLHANMEYKDRRRVMEEAVAGKLAILLVSPEAVVLDGGLNSLLSLPSVAFACIDEVHCLSQWSHNFRPSYLRLCKILRTHFKVTCFLGLTATATQSTLQSVCTHLGVPPEEGVVQGNVLPPNLELSVSNDRDKDAALLQLLQSRPFINCSSIIVYCTRQQQTERVAQMIRTCFQCADLVPPTTAGGRRETKKASKVDLAECYHAGLSAAMRKRVQNKFMSSRLRIVVATVAFGMGLDKSDVRAVIHYNLPRSFESYVQEIGRAGRDGHPAYCHVFLDAEGEDMNELRRHIHSNTVDRFTMKQLVGRVAPSLLTPCSAGPRQAGSTEGITSPALAAGEAATTTTSTPSPLALSEGPQTLTLSETELLNTSPTSCVSPSNCNGHRLALNIAECVEALDVREELLESLLCYLELQGWIELLTVTQDTCTLKCYGSRVQVERLARKVNTVHAALEWCRTKGGIARDGGEMSFSMSAISNQLGVSVRAVRSTLATLCWDDRGTGEPGRRQSDILVEFSHPSFIVQTHCNFTPSDKDGMCDFLHQRVQSQEKQDLAKLQLLCSVLQGAARKAVWVSSDKHGGEQGSKELRMILDKYFMDKLPLPDMKGPRELIEGMTNKQIACVQRDIRCLLSIHDDRQFTARAVARILHGIASPNYPAKVWGMERRFWRSHLDVDFNIVLQLAQTEILSFHCIK